MTTKTESVEHKDWLGHPLNVGDWVVYSSKSTNHGMNLGLVEYIGPSKNPYSNRWIIQVRIVEQTRKGYYGSKGRLITLSSGDSAYKSVTKYPDEMIRFDLEVDPPITR